MIFGVQSNAEQNLVAEAVGVVGAAAKWMKWPGYSFMLRQEAVEQQGLRQVSPLCVWGGCVCGCPK